MKIDRSVDRCRGRSTEAAAAATGMGKVRIDFCEFTVFPEFASPFSSFFECGFDIRRVFCMRMVQYDGFSKSELDKWSFLLGGCDPLRVSGSVPTCFSLSRARAFSGYLFFSFTSSPDGHNYLFCSGLSVKTFDLYHTVNGLYKWL